MPVSVTNDQSELQAVLDEAVEKTELGIQVAAYLGNQLIIDAAAGIADPDTGTKVDSETLFCPFSVTKSVTATVLHIQAERGLIDYDAPIATYWPEFAQNGKAGITVRDVLTHQAGVPWMPEGITPEKQADWAWMISGFEKMTPAYPVGTNCYHALGWGWLIAEVIARADPQGRRFEQVAADELFAPLGITDMFFGLPESQDYRLAKLVGGEIPETSTYPLFFEGMPRPVHPSAMVYNTVTARRTVNPGAGVITNARSMARHFALIANLGEFGGRRLLSREKVNSFLVQRRNSDAEDIYLGMKIPVSSYGYYLADETPGMIPIITPGRPIVWMPGAGCSVGWAELDRGLAVAICHNHMQSYAGVDPHPFIAIADAVRAIADRRTAA